MWPQTGKEGQGQGRVWLLLGTRGSILKAAPGVTSMPLGAGSHSSCPYLSLVLVYQTASLPRFLTLAAPSLLSPWPGSVSGVPFPHQKGCHQTSADLEDVGKIQTFTHVEPWMRSFSGSCFLRGLLDGVIHCGMRSKLGAADPANQVFYTKHPVFSV